MGLVPLEEETGAGGDLALMCEGIIAAHQKGYSPALI